MRTFIAVRALVKQGALLFVLALSACNAANGMKSAQIPAPQLTLAPAAFETLPGWQADNLAEAMAPLQESCAAIGAQPPAAPFGPAGYAGTAADWQQVCDHMPAPAGDPRADEAVARQFFTENFTPYAVRGASETGLFTGYYEPVLHGSLKRKKPYLIPLYARPRDLIAVDLGAFKPALKGQTIMGRVKKDRLIPYYTRAEIDRGALKRRRKVVWVDNAVDAFFLQIQGSGEVILPHRRVMQVGYAAENGRPYTAIGRALVKQGALDPKTVSMQTIRAWLAAHPREAPKIMDLDNSFIFFRKLKSDEGPPGAEGVPLTPGRSLAVDRHFIPYGAPLWLDASAPEMKNAPDSGAIKNLSDSGAIKNLSDSGAINNAPAPGARLQRLMVAQDTGGAITGPVRGDYFWGAGAEAANEAGVMKSSGRYFILLPKTVQVPETFLKAPDSGAIKNTPARAAGAWQDRFFPLLGGISASKTVVYNN